MIDNNMLWQTIYISFTRRMASYDEMYQKRKQMTVAVPNKVAMST